MEVWVRILPALAVASAASVPSLRGVSWSVEDVADVYNKASTTKYIFKLLENDVEYVVTETTKSQQLKFMMMETECLKSENKSIEECDFQEDAVMKICSAFFPMDPERHSIMINCNGPIPVRKNARRRGGRVRCRGPGCFNLLGIV
ncbi:cathelicidin-related antimicrobial peptide Bf-CRAMP-like [Ambystoma mexicanum]|uniref:cathelicidin-related antimicrobial peptide Bf-CRAMP-like n=1 Tax=Ambystoma mexicanum TaxID=8296 RepID=UPI0037E81FAE